MRLLTCIVAMTAALGAAAQSEWSGKIVLATASPYYDDLFTVPFSKGVNIPDWFQSDNKDYVPSVNKYSRRDFAEMHGMGMDVIRVPINFYTYMGNGPDYTFSTEFLTALDSCVERATAEGLYVILDQHGYIGGRGFPADSGEAIITAGLCQMAERYKRHSDHIILELFNEPGGNFLDKNWADMQGRLISELRKIDRNYIIIVTSSGSNGLQSLPDYNDHRLIYTYHFYRPFLFTHQGSWWTELKDVSGVPFPYDAATMPAPPADASSSLRSTFAQYATTGTEEALRATIKGYSDWARANKKLLFVGEFGAQSDDTVDASRTRWYKTVCDAFGENGVPWTAWEYKRQIGSGFGLFHGTNAVEFNLNTELVEAMGLKVPEEYAEGYAGGCPTVTWYDEEIPSWWHQSTGWNGYTPDISYDNRYRPYSGAKCIRWNINNEWGGLTMSIPWMPYADLTTQRDSGASLSFAVRTSDVIDKLQVRFVQHKTGHKQWRNVVEISTTDGSATAHRFRPDGRWHLITIPLSEFRIKGNSNSSSEGWQDAPTDGEQFAWDCVQTLEIVPEGNTKVVGKTLSIDDIVIKR